MALRLKAHTADAAMLFLMVGNKDKKQTPKKKRDKKNNKVRNIIREIKKHTQKKQQNHSNTSGKVFRFSLIFEEITSVCLHQEQKSNTEQTDTHLGVRNCHYQIINPTTGHD